MFIPPEMPNLTLPLKGPHLIYRILPYIMHTHIFGPNFQEKKKSFNFLIQFLYLYLETKPIIVFQGIILHMDIIIAF